MTVDRGDNTRLPRGWRIALALYLAVCAGILVTLDPVAQDPTYHGFADQRTALGIPHIGDVLSNGAFVLVGALGLGFLLGGGRWRQAYDTAGEREPMLAFFTGLLLTGLGSAWYHLQPDNPGLLVDRLTMVLTTAGFVAGLTGDRIRGAGVRMLWPLVAFGLFSVLWWGWTERLGQGDLRPYALFQFGPVLPILALVALRPARYSHSGWYLGALLLYAGARITELADHQVYAALGFASGHNLKHLLAAGVGACLLWMLHRRRRRQEDRPARETGGKRSDLRPGSGPPPLARNGGSPKALSGAYSPENSSAPKEHTEALQKTPEPSRADTIRG